MADKLTARQQAQLALLQGYPPLLEQLHRLIEEIAGLRADETLVRRLCRLLDTRKATADSVGLNSLAETMGAMSTIARRGGGLQMKIQGLREGLRSLKTNYEGALREASTPAREGGATPEARPPSASG
ncbi:MAG TPA: hypothetical protein VGQ17_03240 [Gemmatimonadales bacterium]|jgi:hypothetical protein|nr:hypothetical protein [Gemmatimonadales bacterium]